MKKYVLFLLFYLIVSQGISQSITLDSIACLISENFGYSNLNKPYNQVIESNGFDFSKMEPTDTMLYDSVYVKSYYHNGNLVKVSVIDTVGRGRDFDIRIIYESESIFIGAFVYYDSRNDTVGYFCQDFFLNDKFNKKPLDLIGYYWANISDPNMEYYLPNPKQILYVMGINICDKRLFPEDNLSFDEGQFMYCSTFDYTYKVKVTMLIIQDKDFPIYYAKDLTFDDIYNLTNKYLWKFSSTEFHYFIDVDPVKCKNTPYWLLSRF